MIDAHHHLWKYNYRDYIWMSDEMKALRRDFLVPELQQVMRDSGVRGTIAVQARQTIEETEWLLDLAVNNDFILGVVGWAPLAAGNAAAVLDRFARFPRLKALRHVLHDDPDDFYMLRADFNRGINMLRSSRAGLRYFDLRTPLASDSRICGPPSRADLCNGSHCQAKNPRWNSLPLARLDGRAGETRKCLLQDLRHDDRGGLENLDTGDAATLLRCRTARVWAGPAYVWL